jgi:hypothetical protein
MATCPQCGGYLNEGHRCCGRWRHVISIVGVALVGGLVGVVAVSVLVEHPAAAFVATAGLLGAVLVTALSRAVGFL